MQRGPWWQTGSVLAPSLRTEWCWGTDRSRAPMERPLVRGRPSSEDDSTVAAIAEVWEGGVTPFRPWLNGLCLGRRPSWQVENELGDVFPHVLGSGNVPPPPSTDNHPS